MKGVIFNTLPEAQSLLSQIDMNGGYPKDGVDVGGGKFASDEEATTDHASYVMKHPINDQWAVITENGTSLLVPEGNVIVTLTSDWFPVINP